MARKQLHEQLDDKDALRLLGSTVRDQRKRLSLTQRDLSRQIGVSASWMCEFEKGIIHEVPLQRLQALAQCLEFELEDVLGGVDLSEQMIEPAQHDDILREDKIHRLLIALSRYEPERRDVMIDTMLLWLSRSFAVA